MKISSEFLEEKICNNIDLLEIAIDYCKYNFDKSKEIVNLLILLEHITNKQKELVRNLEG